MCDAPVPFVVPNDWRRLRRLTPARIALGRAGTSLPTAAHLDFQFDHARARDTVHSALRVEIVEDALKSLGLETLVVRSAAGDRQTYLKRPDLGRRLDEQSRRQLIEAAGRSDDRPDLVLAVVDGLSALAIERHAAPFLKALLPRLTDERLTVGAAVVAIQGRVALGDEIAELLQAHLVVVLIGERPGLSSPDSMGIYMTWAPQVGKTDADRNCISNVRADGMSYAAAASKLHYLIRAALRGKLSGVQLKDETNMDGAIIAARPCLSE